MIKSYFIYFNGTIIISPISRQRKKKHRGSRRLSLEAGRSVGELNGMGN